MTLWLISASNQDYNAKKKIKASIRNKKIKKVKVDPKPEKSHYRNQQITGNTTAGLFLTAGDDLRRCEGEPPMKMQQKSVKRAVKFGKCECVRRCRN